MSSHTMKVRATQTNADIYKNATISELDYRVVQIDGKYVFRNIQNVSMKKRKFDNTYVTGEIYMPNVIRAVCGVELDSNVSVTNYDPSQLPLVANTGFLVRIIGRYIKDIVMDRDEVVELLNGQIINTVGHSFCFKTRSGIKIMTTVTETSAMGFVDGETVFLEPGRGIKHFSGADGMVPHNRTSEFTLETDYKKLGVGGLSDEFITIFRRAFVSRIIPPDIAKKLGIKHARGMLMYGPPGCGKTLTARTISKMLKCRNDPKIISGPEIFSKWVGESEQKIRALFEDAEKNRNDFHVIIIDEIDAMCRKRGSSGDGGGGRVSDGVVNQLLAKIDGVNAINNVLLIGMTNRLDIIDPALLRPGRFEVQIEVGLPSESGRVEILNIHTKSMCEGGLMDESVDLETIARETNNFTGAEIEGLVKSAVSFATQRHVDKEDMSKLHDIDKIRVTGSDFQHALGEITPAFGLSDETSLSILIGNGIIDNWIPYTEFENSLRESIFNRVQNTKSILLRGMRGSGKTAVLAKVGLEFGIPFVKYISVSNLLTMTEAQRIHEINSIYNDSLRSNSSVILIDDIERMIEYVDIGPRFSNQLLQCLLVIINKPSNNQLTTILSTSLPLEVLKALGFYIDHVFEIPVPRTREDKERIKHEVGYMDTTASMEDDVPVPIKRFYT